MNEPKHRLPTNWWLPTLGGIFLAILFLVAVASCILSVVVNW